MATIQPAIKIQGLCKSFGEHRVLSGVDLTVMPGEVFALLGPNGAGKTTLISILTTLILPDSGSASVAGHDVVQAAHAARKVFSVTGQSAAVDELLTGRENLMMMARLYGLSRRDARQRAGELLHEFDLEAAADRRVGGYSGGMRRRLDLAISLIMRPPIIFLDEPTTGLDARSRLTLWQAITELAQAGTTIFLTTQYLEEADQLADRIAVLNDGRIVATGTPNQLKAAIGRDRVLLTFTTDDRFQAALQLLGDQRQVQRADPAERVLDVMLSDGGAEVRDLLNLLHTAGIDVRRVEQRSASLDDVFLALTSPRTPANDIDRSRVRDQEDAHV